VRKHLNCRILEFVQAEGRPCVYVDGPSNLLRVPLPKKTDILKSRLLILSNLACLHVVTRSLAVIPILACNPWAVLPR
jgi:hypothetical protein